jgi:hypothetical protein
MAHLLLTKGDYEDGERMLVETTGIVFQQCWRYVEEIEMIDESVCTSFTVDGKIYFVQENVGEIAIMINKALLKNTVMYSDKHL